MSGSLTAEQAKHIIEHEKHVFIIDLRSEEEYKQGHIPGSLNVPLEDIENIKRIIGNRNAIILLYCQSGKNSGCARTVLMYMGFKNVWNVGGINRWPYELVK